MPTQRYEMTRLRSELEALLAPLDHPVTLDAEDDALDALGEWATRELGPMGEPLYAGLRFAGVRGEWRGRSVEVRRS